ncbi:MAG: PEP-CTERM sorting domain-containing protein [Sneathiellales bacterium]|nr:PEP-CTERM sorting domain-containing protein [Sneathiellales bacterium]
MLKKLLVSAIVGAASLLAVTAAHATTFDFTSGTSGWTTGSLNYSSDGIGLGVSSGRYTGGNVIDNGWIRQYNNAGLAIASSVVDNTHEIDGWGWDDVAVFSFDQDVYFESVSFTYNGNNDQFAYFVDSDDDGNLELLNASLDANPTDTFQFTGMLLKAGDLFGIGALGYNDDFKIASVQVSAVPLPPAMALFGGAVLGLGWLSRRRKKS